MGHQKSKAQKSPMASPQSRKQFPKFLLISAAATGSHWLVMAALIAVGISAYWGTAIGAVVGAVVNYLGQRNIVFAHQGPHQQALPRYLVAVGINWLLNLGLFAALFAGLQLPVILSQVLTTAIVAGASFFLYRRFVFVQIQPK
jgi:putative flippase GtrA